MYRTEITYLIGTFTSCIILAAIITGHLYNTTTQRLNENLESSTFEVDTLVSDWPVTGGNWSGHRYSSLRDINRNNVNKLEIAWTYRHGDVKKGSWIAPLKPFTSTSFEATPIIVGDLLIFSTPFNRVVALDPQTGEEQWAFDPDLDTGRRFANGMVSRGVEYWHDQKASGFCTGRIFLGTLDARLIALDAETGNPCPDFGNNGTINLLKGLDPLADSWEYNVTSPPVIVGDHVIIGSSIADLIRRQQPPGVVRAYHAKTGKLVWRFNTIPNSSDAYGADTWKDGSWRRTGGANVWAPMTADIKRGLIFLPVSAAGPDFYGGDRKGKNLFANSLVSLDAKTGERVWHFQTVHHDLWDNDVASPPLLVTLTIDGKPKDAVIQLTKMGLVFVLDRETGNPFYPVEERAVPSSDVYGEETWPTQPFPDWPPPLVPHEIKENDLWNKSQDHLKSCTELLGSLRNEGIYTPPSEQGSILVPGNSGGANWSGGSWDPKSQTLYVPLTNMPMVIQLQKINKENFDNTDRKVLQGGIPAILWAINKRGTGLRFWTDRKFFAIGDVPCISPPWGWITALDFKNKAISWRTPSGINKDGIKGLRTAGPILTTAGGLVFHGGATDQKLWVYDAENGDIVTSFELPAGLHAGPITYKLSKNGIQYLVVTPGGHTGIGSQRGDFVIAYTLPD